MSVEHEQKPSNINNYQIDSTQIPISEFKLDEMAPNPSIVMIAKRGSGKSWVAKAILQKLKEIPVGIIISPTELDNPFYSLFFPDAFIYYEYDSNVIKKLLFRQKLILKKSKEYPDKKIDPRAFIIMDDCLASKGAWAKDPAIHDLLFNGRHRQITYILTMQFPLGIKPELRLNFDYIFLLADDQISNLKRIHEHYAGVFADFNSFRQVFRELTEDFGCMVIKNKSNVSNKTNGVLDKIAFYKAPNLHNTQLAIGCNQFRKFHEKNYDKDWDEKKFAMDYNELLLDKKRTSKLNVKKIFDSKGHFKPQSSFV